ncbi:MAG: monovalent cation/H+ antiporter subunit D family protein [Pseudomonadota bacterium]
MSEFLSSVYQHAPMLAVVIPLLAGPVALLFGNRSAAFYISFVAAGLSFWLSLVLLYWVKDGTVLSYHIGGWAPPLGIEYRVDVANAFVLMIVSAMGFVMLPYARTSIAKEIEERHHTLFYACYLLCLTGLLGVTITGDAFNVFVFLEISSLSTYVLVALGASKDKRALSAAYDYLVLGTIGATFFVIGLGFLYMATGTLNLVDLAQRIEPLADNRTVRAGFALIVIGMGLKLAVFPLHRWLPGAYAYAPSAVSAFLASTATKVALYVAIRFMFSVYSAKFSFETLTLEYIILPLAVIAMFAASFIAIYQQNVKRLLAFSSVAQIGYMLLGISLLNVTGVSAGLIHMFNHAVTKGALFLAVGAIVWRTGSALLPNMAGLGKTMPWTSATIVIGGLSLIGIPSTAGFVSKWALLSASLEKGWWPIAFLIVASSLIAVIYVWRVLEVLYLREPAENSQKGEAPLSLLIPTWILALASILFGFNGEFATQFTLVAGQQLLDGGFQGAQTLVIGVPGR